MNTATLMRGAAEAWNAGDVDAAVGMFDPDVEYDNSRVALDQPPLRGRDQVHAAWQDVLERWSEFHVDVRQVLDAGERAVVDLLWSARGAGSGVTVELDVSAALRVRDGRVTSWIAYRSAGEALEALGLLDLDLVRRIYESWDPIVAPPWELLAEDIEWVNPPEAVEPGTRRGKDDFAAALRNLEEAYPGAGLEITDLVDAGGGVIAVTGRFHARGRSSGLETAAPHGAVWTVQDGKAARFAWFPTPEQALEAAGAV